MHNVEIGQDIVARVLARRGRLHLFDSLDPAKTAFVIIDMQNLFCEPGAPAEVPTSRGIVDNINTLNRALRPLGSHIIWIYSATVTSNGKSDWDKFLNTFVAAEMRERTREAMRPDGHGAKLWRGLEVEDTDLQIVKNRYSCFTPGSSQLERVLRGLGVENVLIGGTKTNIC
ncbi:MAG: cysteine hydrolase, partial [Proteobacteria bacterium]|nr:cysteine hydrolase [Pseudomonadota bacterium]